MQRENYDRNSKFAKLISKKDVAQLKVSNYKEIYLIAPVSIYQEMMYNINIKHLRNFLKFHY